MTTILLIEDDEFLRGSLSRYLEMSGYAVIKARDGLEGLKICRIIIPDLIITDLIMPNKEDLETIRQMKKEAPRLPILAMSGGHYGSETNLRSACLLGAERVYLKPFSLQEMAESIKEILAIQK